jgi:hypothetical protein
LHWLHHAATPGQAATAKLIFVAWLQERGLVVMDELSRRPW